MLRSSLYWLSLWCSVARTSRYCWGVVVRSAVTEWVRHGVVAVSLCCWAFGRGFRSGAFFLAICLIHLISIHYG